MLRHIVMMKFQNIDNLESAAAKTKLMLENLKRTISTLINMEVGLNISDRPTAYDLVLIADFKSEDDLSYYRIHPEHIKVLDYIKTVVSKTTVVDYFI